MSVFDEIFHDSACPYCGCNSHFITQVKHENAWQKRVAIGCRILDSDASYVLEGWSNPNCRECDKMVNFDVVIEKGTVQEVRARSKEASS